MTHSLQMQRRSIPPEIKFKKAGFQLVNGLQSSLKFVSDNCIKTGHQILKENMLSAYASPTGYWRRSAPKKRQSKGQKATMNRDW